MAEPIVEHGNLVGALSMMAQEFASAGGSRVRRFDQLAADSAAMWAIHMTTPNVMSALGYQATAGHMPPRQTELSVAPAKGT